MADVNTQEEPTTATDEGAAPDTQEQGKGIEGVDQDALKRYVDSQVSKALKTREEKLKSQQQKEREAAEAKQAEERGEFGKLKGQYEQQIAQMKAALVQKDVQHSLAKHAADAGLIDMDDLVHVVDAAVAEAVGDDGSVDDAKVRAVLDEFKKLKPHKFKDANPEPRFRGAPTPGTQQAPAAGPSFGPDSTDAYVKQRNEQLKALKRPSKPRSNIDHIAEAVSRRLSRT